jgi:hypothetical protein
MYPGSGTESASTVYQNAPSMSMMFTMYSNTFGNGSFMMTPPSSGEVGDGFPALSYLSPEAIFYQQQASNRISSPVNTLSGSNTGQQVINGQYTMQDSNGTSRYQQGYQSTSS